MNDNSNKYNEILNKEKKVSDHYDGSADNYHLQYERNLINDLTRCISWKLF